MIQEAYVSFEVAKLLKEKGFNQETVKRYNPSGSLYSYYQNVTVIPKGEEYFFAPTQQMAMRWLREVHNIGVFPTTYYRKTKEHKGYNYGCDLVDLKTYEVIGDFELTTFPSDTYEQACEAAIKYCLENLIKED